MQKPSGTFRHDARENQTRDTVEFTLDFNDRGASTVVACHVSREALEDRAGTSGEVPLLELYETYRPEVWAAIDRRLKPGQWDANNTIIVRTGELRPG